MFRDSLLSRLIRIIILATLLAAPASAGEETNVISLFDRETGVRIEALLVGRDTQVGPFIGAARVLSHEQMFEFYQQREFLPIWIDGWYLKPAAHTLLETLRNAGAHGLCSSDYLLSELEGLTLVHTGYAWHLPLGADRRAVLDLYLSQAFLTYATHMVEGQVDPSLAHVDWNARRRKADLVKLLEYAIENDRLTQVLEDLVPPHAEYRQLVAALDDYQKIAALGGWPVIPPGPTIRPGDLDERVPLLRDLLIRTGDLDTVTEVTDAYDPATGEALQRFQARHGLVSDGAVGLKTLEALNVPVEERVHQIELNLERWRWMPKSFGDRHIRVNVADFSLEVVEDARLVMQMSVVVGTQYRKTPVFSASMTYLEFAPYWTVPPTILREDKLPLIKRNPGYLEEKHYRIVAYNDARKFIDPWQIDWKSVTASNFPGLLRMEPGPWNPLGRVKFMFPNSHNVYLHDTNEASLFDKNIRSFSSGCIRIERPRELAGYLMQKELDDKRLQGLFKATSPVRVSIAALPIHIQYWTAWVDREGLMHFRPDVYFRDLDLQIALNEPAYRVMDQLQAGAGTNLPIDNNRLEEVFEPTESNDGADGRTEG